MAYGFRGARKNSDTSLSAPTADSKVYAGRFSIDPDRKLVKFDEPVYRNTVHTAANATPATIAIDAAQLVLRTACTIVEADTLGVVRYRRAKKTGSNRGGAVHQIRREELLHATIPEYSQNSGQYNAQLASGSGVKTTSNLTVLDQQADDYIRAALDDFAAVVPQSRVYAGLKNINPDGAIQQVIFVVGPEGAFTIANRNNERLDMAMSYQQQRFNQRVHEALKAQQASAAQQRRDRRRGS